MNIYSSEKFATVQLKLDTSKTNLIIGEYFDA